MVRPLYAFSELEFLCAFIIPIPTVSTLKVQQMVRVREILQNAKAKGHQVLDTDDVVEISTGLINYLLFTTGTHPNNRGMLRLDEPDVPVKDQKPSPSLLVQQLTTSDSKFAKLFDWMRKR